MFYHFFIFHLYIILLFFVLLSGSAFLSSPIFAEPPDLHRGMDSDHGSVDSVCLSDLDIETVILCTLKHSPEYKTAKYELEATLGRKRIAEYAFPSNPVVSAMGANRRIEEGRFPPKGSESVINGEILFSQEFYVGGQRQARVNMANQEVSSKLKRIQAIERMTISEAIRGAILLQAAEEEWKFATELHRVSLSIAKSSRKRFENGLGNEMDADLAEAEAMRNFSYLESVSRKRKEAIANVTVMMGIPFRDALAIKSGIRIFPIQEMKLDSFIELAEKRRPDLEAIQYEMQFAKSIIRVLERDRIPNITVSGFVQNDGFNERVVGARVSLPLQLWRDNSGEILEAKANAKKSKSLSEVAEHAVKLEAINAWNEVESWKKVWNQYPPNTIQRTDANIAILNQAVASGNMSIRDAILSIRSMIELKSNYFQSKVGYALACAEYLRAGGESYSSYLRQESKK
ncbi:MAG: TolC family protein [Leptospira sp.]|nr:TolC family protein [Leptospira sp.]